MLEIESWYELREEDFKNYGHLESVNYYSYSEKARHEIQEKLNIPDSALVKRDIGFFIGDRRIRHKKEIKSRKMKVVSSIREIPKRQIIKVDQEFYNDIGELCAKGYIIHVFKDLNTGKMIMPPEDFMQTLRGYF